MTQDTDRPFSRFYAELLREAGEEVPTVEERRIDGLGLPKLANPRPGSESDS